VQINKIAAEQMGDSLQHENSDITDNQCFNGSGNRAAEEVRIHQLYARRIGGQIQSPLFVFFQFTSFQFPYRHW
jgi:hypothetical protein